jgi:hypothetical protein
MENIADAMTLEAEREVLAIQRRFGVSEFLLKELAVDLIIKQAWLDGAAWMHKELGVPVMNIIHGKDQPPT